jgi:hypothetical protein
MWRTHDAHVKLTTTMSKREQIEKILGHYFEDYTGSFIFESAIEEIMALAGSPRVYNLTKVQMDKINKIPKANIPPGVVTEVEKPIGEWEKELKENVENLHNQDKLIPLIRRIEQAAYQRGYETGSKVRENEIASQIELLKQWLNRNTRWPITDEDIKVWLLGEPINKINV